MGRFVWREERGIVLFCYALDEARGRGGLCSTTLCSWCINSSRPLLWWPMIQLSCKHDMSEKVLTLNDSSHMTSLERHDKPANCREFPAMDPAPPPMGCEADENQHAWQTEAEWRSGNVRCAKDCKIL